MDTQIQHKAFLLLLALVTVAFFWLLLPFYGAVFWAVILAIVFAAAAARFERRLRPAQQPRGRPERARLHRHRHHPGHAHRRHRWSTRAPSWCSGCRAARSTRRRDLERLQAALPDLGCSSWLDRVGVGDLDALRGPAARAAAAGRPVIAARALSIGQDTLRFFASIGIMLYVLFFLFRDGRAIARNIRAAMPLSDDYNRALLDRSPRWCARRSRATSSSPSSRARSAASPSGCSASRARCSGAC